MNQWQIIDDNGVIDSGNEDQMREQFRKYESGEETLEGGWKGDLKLVEVHAVIG